MSVPGPPVFVVGHPRSGTSLLARLLDGHPALLSFPHETHVEHWCAAPDPTAAFFEETRWGEVLPEGSEDRRRFEAALRAQVPGPAGIGAALLAVAAALLELRPQPEARHWVEKTPRHLRLVPLLHASFGPETRSVGIVRDPRAVLASMRARWPGQRRHAVRPFAARWTLYTELVERIAAQEPGFLALRYEDLVADTEGTMRAVARHLQLPWSDVLLRPTREGATWSSNSSFGDRSEGVSRGSVDRWQQSLPADDVARLDALLRAPMERWSYAPLAPVRSAPAWDRLRLRASVSRDLRALRRLWTAAPPLV